MKYKIILAFFIFLSSTFDLSAKRYNPYGTDWAFGVHFGGTGFFGDINGGTGPLNSTPFSKYFYQNASLMGGVALDKWFGPYIGLSGKMQYGHIQGTKETSYATFTANYFEYNISVVGNLSNLFFGVDRRRNHMIYSSLGMGLSESRTWKYSTKGDGTTLIGTNGFGNPRSEGGKYVPMTETIITTALGVKFYIGSNLSFNIEGSVHAINSDKLDATANDYANQNFIAGLEGYTYFNIGMQYHFGGDGRYASGSYKHKSRYTSSRGGAGEINMRKRNKAWRKIQRKKKSRFTIKKH
ncbi:MAG: hypothetical protein KAG84_02090 [Bacteroidales bacterium]|nr:hypothetical protein [Bacteroidales bacterium]